MAHTHTYSPTRRRGDQEGREGLFGARTTMQEGARCPSQETDRSAGARCFALQGIRILLPWERPHWHNDEAWSPDPACARGRRAINQGDSYVLHSAFRRAPLVEGRNADAVSCGAPTRDARPLDPRSCTYVKLPSPRQHHGTRRAHIKRRGQVTHRPYSGARATGGVDSRYLVSGGQVHAHARARAHAHVRRHQPCAL